MPIDPSQKMQVVQSLNQIYEEIRAIESDLHIQAEAEDLRPRIEHFHDAIRLLMKPRHNEEEKERLTVEQLANDLNQLRAISDSPIPAHYGLSHGTEVSHAEELYDIQAMMGTKRRRRLPQADDLAQLYTTYSVLFAALMAETVDKNYKTQLNEMDGQVEDMAQVEQVIKLALQQNLSQEQIEDLVNQIQNEELMQKILQVLLHARSQGKHKLEEMFQQLQHMMKQVDLEIGLLEKAHFSYLASQLAVYEQSKDTVKKLAAQGLNLAGQFVQTEAAKGQGQGFRGR